MRSKLPSAIATLLLGFAAIHATAANFLVDTTLNDLSDLDPGDGECAWATFVPVGQRCTLRAAVAEANALAGADTIVIPAGMQIVLANGTLGITSDITIGSLAEGDARPIINADFKSRVFSATAPLRLVRLAIQHGRALGGQGENSGGAIVAGLGDYQLSIEDCDLFDNAAGGGGAITAQNTDVQIVDSTFTGNLLIDPTVDVYPFGSAVWVANENAALTIERSTFWGNTSFRNDSGGAGSAIAVNAQSAEILDSTIDSNLQGGVTEPFGSDLVLANTTISNNGHFGVAMNGAVSVSLTIRNSILSGNEVGCTFDAPAVFVSASYSLDEDDSCGFFPSSDNLIGVDPMLGPLADNGGPTKTRSLLPGSPARDAGDPAPPGGPISCLVTDQRGAARPQPSTFGGIARCDMGAVEVPEPGRDRLAVVALASLAGLAAPLSSPIRRRGAARRPRRARAAAPHPR